MSLVTSPFLVKGCEARPEKGNLKHQLGTVELQKLDIVGDLELLPHVVCDGTTHMTLTIGIIGNPALRTRIEVERIRLLLSVASALPGKHCAIVSGNSSGNAGFTETSVAIRQQGPSDLGYTKVEEWKDK
jgi:hypothetical protein